MFWLKSREDEIVEPGTVIDVMMSMFYKGALHLSFMIFFQGTLRNIETDLCLEITSNGLIMNICDDMNSEQWWNFRTPHR